MAKKEIKLGRLEAVELRQAWESEAGDFTPWLARDENLVLLGEVIGIELELEETEVSVGSFRGDILCKDTRTDEWVLIENQLERTDHSHLGQLITYAAGLTARTVVWIALRFTEEHRAALDFLNEITADDFNFIGLEVELWRIGDSEMAPKFNIVAKPNEWSRTVAERARLSGEGGLTEKSRLQLDYWIQFREFVLNGSTNLRPQKPAPRGYMSFSVGRTGFGLSAVASWKNSRTSSFESNEIRAEFVIQHDMGDSFFEALEGDREEIEEALGQPLVWHNPPNTQMKRIYLARDADLTDRESWGDQHGWLHQQIEAFDSVFRKRVQRLEVTRGD